MEKKYVEVAGSISEKDPQRPWPPGIEPFFSKTDHNPRELKSWAKRTGFNPNFSGEANLSSVIDEGGEDPAPALQTGKDSAFDLEKGLGRGRRKGAASNVKMEPILGQRSARVEINPVTDPEPVSLKDVGKSYEKESSGIAPDLGFKKDREMGNDLPMRLKNDGINGGGRGNGEVVAAIEPRDGEPKKDDLEINLIVDSPDQDNTPPFKSGLICELMENPSFGLRCRAFSWFVRI